MDASVNDKSISVYEMLGRLFLSPLDAAGYQAVVRDRLLRRSFEMYGSVKVRTGLAHADSAADALSAMGDEEGRKALATEYTSYFVGPERQLVPPWESLYQGDRKHLFAPPVRGVRAFMRSIGLKNQQFGHYPEDHIGFELLLLAAVDERGDLDDNAATTTAHFIREHALPLCNDMLQKAHDEQDLGSGFYVALIEVTKGVLESDLEGLSAV